MVSSRHPTTIQNLPIEVLSEIFIRLLAKQLAQMRSVCKPWNALLSDSSFIKSHLHHSLQNNDEILLFFGFMFSFKHSPFTARTSRSPDLELTNFIKPPVNLPSKVKYQSGLVIGSVNGLICFTYGSYYNGFLVHIWNPSLSALLTLPPFPLGLHRIHFGFGFDPKSDDYKIVKLTSFPRASYKVAHAEVYSMRKGSWKLISSETFPSHITIPEVHYSQVCVDDHLHWLGYTDLGSNPQTVVAFDLGADTFTELPLPETILDFKVYKPLNVLGVLGGKLCVISRVRDGKWEVWVMDKYGVAESWARHQVFPPFSGDIIPYGFTSDGEFLFKVGINDDHFALYDPIAAKTKTFKIMSRNYYKMNIVEYVDSLVWIAPANRI